MALVIPHLRILCLLVSSKAIKDVFVLSLIFTIFGIKSQNVFLHTSYVPLVLRIPNSDIVFCNIITFF